MNNAYIGLLKTGSNNTGNTVSYDSSKRYELGYYNGGGSISTANKDWTIRIYNK